MAIIDITDKSVVKIRENHEFTIQDTANTRSLIIDKGHSLHYNVHGKKYRVETSVSVASVKG